MEPDARYSLVGTAVLVLLAALAAGVVWLAAAGNNRDTRLFRVHFVKQSLEGLDVRSDVRMKGIRVGDVKSLSFSRQSTGTVEVTLAVDPRAPVLQSTLIDGLPWGDRAAAQAQLTYQHPVRVAIRATALLPPKSGVPS